jgi:hypothetical protein
LWFLRKEKGPESLAAFTAQKLYKSDDRQLAATVYHRFAETLKETDEESLCRLAERWRPISAPDSCD